MDEYMIDSAYSYNSSCKSHSSDGGQIVVVPVQNHCWAPENCEGRGVDQTLADSLGQSAHYILLNCVDLSSIWMFGTGTN